MKAQWGNIPLCPLTCLISDPVRVSVTFFIGYVYVVRSMKFKEIFTDSVKILYRDIKCRYLTAFIPNVTKIYRTGHNGKVGSVRLK